MVAIPLIERDRLAGLGALLGLDGSGASRAGNGSTSWRPCPRSSLAGVVLAYLTDRRRRPRGSPRTSAPGSRSASRTNGGPESARSYSVKEALTNGRVLAVAFRLLRQRGAALRAQLLPAADREGLRPHELPDRPREPHPLRAIGIVGMIVLGRSSDRKGDAGATSPSRCCSPPAGRPGRPWSPIPMPRWPCSASRPSASSAAFRVLDPADRLPLRRAAAGGIAIINALATCPVSPRPTRSARSRTPPARSRAGSSSSRRRARGHGDGPVPAPRQPPEQVPAPARSRRNRRKARRGGNAALRSPRRGGKSTIESGEGPNPRSSP